MSDNQGSPKSFISHASEDKADYARPLAEALLAQGVDVWLDEWEMGPGDSLIKKIFSEGIKTSDAMVIVLSETSITKPWVEKELNVAAVNNIQREMKLVPVRVDSSEVPEVLTDLYWIDWHKEGSAEAVAKRIAVQLFGVTKKPPLGSPPPQLSSPKFTVPGLYPQDIKVLEIIFNASLVNRVTLIQADTILPLAEEEGITFEQIKESIQMLEQKGFLENKDRTMAQRHIVVTFNAFSHLVVARSLGHPVEDMTRRIVSLVVNEQIHNLDALASRMPEYATALLRSAIEVLESQGFWRSTSVGGGDRHIFGPTVAAERWLQENS